MSRDSVTSPARPARGDEPAYPVDQGQQCDGANPTGLTIREAFAMAVLPAIVSNHPPLVISNAPNRYAMEAAKQATYYADALIAELAKVKP